MAHEPWPAWMAIINEAEDAAPKPTVHQPIPIGRPEIEVVLATWVLEARRKDAQVTAAWQAWRKALADFAEAAQRAAGIGARGRRHRRSPAFLQARRDEEEADVRADKALALLSSLLGGG